MWQKCHAQSGPEKLLLALQAASPSLSLQGAMYSTSSPFLAQLFKQPWLFKVKASAVDSSFKLVSQL